MSKPGTTPTKPEFAVEEVNIKEIILVGVDYFWEILHFWWIPAILGGAIAYLNYSNAAKESITYSAKATFVISDKKEDVVWNDFTSLDLGIAERKAIKYNLDKVVELTRSRKVVQRALFEKITIDSMEDYIANHMIRIYDYHKQWIEANEDMGDFYFTHDTIAQFDRKENKALKNLYYKTIGTVNIEALVVIGYDEESTVLRIAGKTVNETLTLSLVQFIYEHLAKFYMEVEIERQNTIFNLIYEANDSIKYKLTAAQRRLLTYQDRNQGLSLRQYDSRKLLLEQEVEMWMINYSESFKNLQATKAALANTIPFIHPIDMPITPLRPSIVSKMGAAISGIFIGGVLGVVLIVAKKILWQIMGWEKKEEKQAESKQD